jgi:hypothetical protein
VEVGTDGDGGIGIDGAIAAFDVANDAVFVDDDVGAQSPLVVVALHVIFFEDAVIGEHLAVHVAEERKLDVDRLGEGGVCCGGIHTYTENFRIVGVDLTRGESSLDRLQLLRSTTGEGENIDGEENIFLAVIIAELDGFPLIAEQGEVGSFVADFERELGDFFLVLGLRGRRSQRGGHGEKQTGGEQTFHKVLLSGIGMGRKG